MGPDEKEDVEPPAPGLFFLAASSPWVGEGKRYPHCLIEDGTLARRLRSAWKQVKKIVGNDEVGLRYLEKAAAAGKKREWVDCAGWMEAARRRVLKPEDR